ncbi:hypothetical protein QUF80_17015 [Desulfococcaceae bacterium HSG8]|nr:hypothetical protein [Desulfococcaceae bacterium HSG8]
MANPGKGWELYITGGDLEFAPSITIKLKSGLCPAGLCQLTLEVTYTTEGMNTR